MWDALIMQTGLQVNFHLLFLTVS